MYKGHVLCTGAAEQSGGKAEKNHSVVPERDELPWNWLRVGLIRLESDYFEGADPRTPPLDTRTSPSG